MISVSLCMIVKNEQDTLERCLGSVAGICEEIVIVDTGSADRTKEVARRFTDKIYDFEWIDDFSAARNYSYAQATKDYILWLDADDVLADTQKFRKLKETLPPDTDAVMMKYNTAFDEQGRVTFSYYRERLTRRSGGFKWCEPVHEYLEVGGKILNSDICINHEKPAGRSGDGRNMRIYENILAGGAELSTRGVFYYARELKDNGRFQEAAGWFQRFLDSGAGWVEDNISACGDLGFCLESLGDKTGALNAMLRGFSYDTPRAELCCQIGYHYSGSGDYRRAAFWFELALGLEGPEGGFGFRQQECRDYIPCIELAVCYSNLGDYRKASEYNERAGIYKPDSPAVAHNRAFFKGIRRI